MDQGSVATERGALREACVSSLNRSYFRHEYSPSPVVSGQSHLIPDPLTVIPIPVANGSGISSGS